MNIKWIFFLVLLCFTNVCRGEELKAVQLRGVQLKACAVAWEDFSKSKDAANLEHYTVAVFESTDGSCFEIYFSPDQVPGKESYGATPYGSGVKYQISKEKYTIIRRTFSR
jgi:hypothetical protein